MPQRLIPGPVLDSLLAQLQVVQGNQLLLSTASGHAVQLDCPPHVALRVSSLHSSGAFIEADQQNMEAIERILATQERQVEEAAPLMLQYRQRVVQEDLRLSDSERRATSQKDERDLRAWKRTSQRDLRAMKEKKQRLDEAIRRDTIL